MAELHFDTFGRAWPFAESELCPVCGQPDNCGDCDHTRLSTEQVMDLRGGISAAARNLAHQHNQDSVVSGCIYLVDLKTGAIGEFVASFAAEQPPIEERREKQYALMRISHGRLTRREAQRFIDDLGEGW